MKTKIEVIGLPGAGKTTFFKKNNQYASIFNCDRVTELNSRRKLNLRIVFMTMLICYFVRSPELIGFIFSNKHRLWIFKKLAYRMQFLSNKKSSKPHLEKGLLQVILTDAVEHSEHNSTKYYLAFLRLLPKPDTIIHFDIEPQLALQRFKLRGDSEKRDITFSEIQNLDITRFEFGNRVIKAILKHYKSRQVKIITLKQNMELAEIKFLFSQVNFKG